MSRQACLLPAPPASCLSAFCLRSAAHGSYIQFSPLITGLPDFSSYHRCWIAQNRDPPTPSTAIPHSVLPHSPFPLPIPHSAFLTPPSRSPFPNSALCTPHFLHYPLGAGL